MNLKAFEKRGMMWMMWCDMSTMSCGDAGWINSKYLIGSKKDHLIVDSDLELEIGIGPF